MACLSRCLSCCWRSSAGAIACQFEGRLLRAFTLFAFFCSLPTYLMLWNAQMHVLLVLAVALTLGGLVGLERDEQRSTRSLRMLQIGLLISLLSKPVALLAAAGLVCDARDPAGVDSAGRDVCRRYPCCFC